MDLGMTGEIGIRYNGIEPSITGIGYNRNEESGIA